MTRPRNVLIVVADQWRGDHLPLGCGGDIDLPNLAYLARHGTCLTRHYCNASPCGPARMSLLTGQYVMNHRVVQNGVPLREGRTNLALELKRLGYPVGLVGYTSWIPDPYHTPSTDARFSMYGANMPGFDPVRSFEEPEFEPYFDYLRSVGYHLPVDPFGIWDGTVTEDVIRPSPVVSEHSDTRWMTDAAVDYIRAHRGKPWSLFLGYWRPHPPLSASPPYHEFCSPDSMADPIRALSKDEEAAAHPVLRYLIDCVKSGDYLQGAEGLASDLPKSAIRNARAVYRGLMKEIDDNIGRLIACLEETDAWDNTLIVFTSDHGEMLGDHYLFGKESYFDPTFHVPLIVRDPTRAADAGRGRRLDAFTEHVDIMPTVLEFLDASVPRQCDGLSLRHLLSGRQVGWRDHAFMEVDFRDLRLARLFQLPVEVDQCGAAVLRGRRYKYVHFAGFEPILFDLDEDPHEFTNIAEDRQRREVLVACMRDMLDWRIAHADRTLTSVSSSANGIVGWPNMRSSRVA